MTTTTTDMTPRVWIGCLAHYNNGSLVGEWFDAENADQITRAQVHGSQGRVAWDCEELWVMDHENLPVSGEMSPYDAAQWAEALGEVDQDLLPALYAWIQSGAHTTQGNTELPVTSDFIDNYRGEYTSFRDYVEELCQDAGMFENAPQVCVDYFDWDHYARDEELSYLVLDAPSGNVFVFTT